MEIETFQKNIKNIDIDLKPYLIVVAILLSTLFLFVLFNKGFSDYFLVTSKVKNNKVIIVVEDEKLEKIVNSQNLIIGKDTFTYKVEEINDYIYENILLKEVTIEIKDLNEDKKIENNILKLKIITGKTNILNYLIKLIKGE